MTKCDRSAKLIDEMQNGERALLIRRSTEATQMYYTTMASICWGRCWASSRSSRFSGCCGSIGTTARHGRRAVRTARAARNTLASIGDAVIATDDKAQHRIHQSSGRESHGLGRRRCQRQAAQGSAADHQRNHSRAGGESRRPRAGRGHRRRPGESHAADPQRRRRDSNRRQRRADPRPDGKVTGCVLVFRDIVERKQAEAEINRLLDKRKAPRRATSRSSPMPR